MEVKSPSIPSLTTFVPTPGKLDTSCNTVSISQLELLKHHLCNAPTSENNTDQFPSITTCSLSVPTIYKSKGTSPWIVTACRGICERLLDCKHPNEMKMTGHDLINSLLKHQNRDDRMMASGVWQLLLDEGAIEQVNVNKHGNTGKIFEFLDSKQAWYTCKCPTDNVMSLEEAVAMIDSKDLCNNRHMNDNPVLLDKGRPSSAGDNQIPNENDPDAMDIEDSYIVEDRFQLMLDRLYQMSPEALFRQILQKTPSHRSEQDLNFLFQELLLIPCLGQFSMSVRDELCKCLRYEVHPNAKHVIFHQGDVGTSWYIIYRGSVWIHVDGQGYVCRLSEGDDFGKLALVTEAPRAATVVTAEDNCHLLRVDKDDFNRILKNVEANTIRLKKNDSDVLILERIPDKVEKNQSQIPNQQQQQQQQQNQTSESKVELESVEQCSNKYFIVAGTVEQIVHHLLETRLSKLEHRLPEIVDDAILEPHLCARSLSDLEQVWENFFLTYSMYTNSQIIFAILLNYVQYEKNSWLQRNSPRKLANSDLSNNVSQSSAEFSRYARVILFVYVWRYCLGLFAFGNLDGITEFLINFKTTILEDMGVGFLTLHLSALEKLIHTNENLQKSNENPDHLDGCTSLNQSQTTQSPMSKRHLNMLNRSMRFKQTEHHVIHSLNFHRSTEHVDLNERLVNLKLNYLGKLYTDLLLGFQITPSQLPLIKGFQKFICPIYLFESQKHINITTPVDATVGDIKAMALKHDQTNIDPKSFKLVEVSSKGDVNMFHDEDCGSVFEMSPNGRLFLVHESKVNSLAPLPEQLSVAMNYVEQFEAERTRQAHDMHHWSIRNELPLLKRSKSTHNQVKLLDELTIEELACILACCHVNLAICITPYELLDYTLGSKRTKNPAPHVRALVRRFSLLHTWTVTQILTTCHLARRANLIKKLIKLADRLISFPLYDLHSAFAILLGLQNSTVTRLTQTWERVPNRWKRLLTNRLVPLTDPARNHRTAREWCASVKGPHLPFLGLILKDLRFAEDANKTDYHESSEQVRLINFEKMRLVARSLRLWTQAISGYELLHPNIASVGAECLKSQSSLNNAAVQKLAEVSVDLQNFVMEHLESIDDSRVLTQLSLRLESRK